jgi:hypothetical protein
MFSNYLATRKDLKTVEEGLKFVLHPKMRLVFKDKSKIVNTAVISYDSKFIYIWKINPVKLTYKIPHNLDIPDEWQNGWWAGIVSKQIKKYLPDEIKKTTRFEVPIISGGFLTPFIALQKEKSAYANPYITKESYLATMIHEFGHVYWNGFKLWWPSSKKVNLDYIQTAINLYSSGKSSGLSKKNLFHIPSPAYLGEVFAFCTEYCSSEFFWPRHKQNMDKFAIFQIEKMAHEEKLKDLSTQDSTFEPTINPHNYALMVGKIILTQFPTNWTSTLTKPLTLA